MATEIDKILVKIEADMSQLNRELKRLDNKMKDSTDKVKTNTDKMSLAFKRLGAALVAYVGVQGVAQLAMFASSVEENMAKAEVVFGQSFGSVRDELESFGDSVGRSTYELVSMAATVQDTFVPLGFARDQAADLSVQLAKLAVDVASFNNSTDTEVMEAFQSAIVGNHETVRRFGIVITEATLQQELYRMGIYKSTQEATNAEKVQARLNMITAGTSDAHGDAVRTSDSFANSTKALGAALDELGVAVMAPFMDDLAEFIQLLTRGVNAMTGFFDQFGDPSNLEAVQQEIDGVLDKIGTLEDRLYEQKSKGVAPRMLQGIEQQIKTAKAELVALQKLRESLSKPVTVTVTSSKTDEGPDLSAYLTAEKDLKTRMKQLSLEMLGYSSGAAKVGSLDLNLEVNEEGVSGATKDALNDLQKLMKDFADQDKAFADLKAGKAILEMLTPAEKVQEKIDQLTLAMEKYNLVNDEAANEKLKNLQHELKMTDPSFSALVSAAQAAADSVSDAFADMVMSGQYSLDGFKDIAKQFVAQMIKMQLQLSIMNPIMNSVFSLSGDSALPTGGFNWGSIGLGAPSAGGGQMHPSVPRLVGERGPELFVPHSAGTLLNNANTGSALGGGAPVIVNQSLNFSLGVQDTVRAEVVNMLPAINESAVSAVQEAKMRGGSFASTFGS